MTYQPQLGDFGIVKTKGWLGKLIRVGTLSRWNHAFVYIGDGNIIEATPRGVIVSPVSKYEHIAWNQHEELTTTERLGIVKYAQMFIGSAYGFFDIFNLALRILGLRLIANTRLMEYLAKSEGVICSELVSICYSAVNVQLTDKYDYLVTPGDLAEVLIYQ